MSYALSGDYDRCVYIYISQAVCKISGFHIASLLFLKIYLILKYQLILIWVSLAYR